MLYAILVSGSLLFGPSGWDPQAFQRAMNLSSTSLPATAPSAEIDIGPYAIVTVTETKPTFNSATQQLVAQPLIISGNSLSINYVAQNLPPPTAQALYDAAIAAGLTIACATNATVCTPSITGTYKVDPISQADIAANRLSILADGVQSNGQASMPWADMSGAFHTMSIAQFNEFSTATKQYVAALKLYVLTVQQGGTAALPASTAQLQ
jgi:hypothetical protein